MRTPKVARHLSTIQGHVGKLQKHLITINPAGKSGVRLFFHQLASGSEDEKNIEKILRDLEGGKSSLMLAIQVVAVGFGKDKKGTNYVNITSVRRVDALLREKLGQDKGLKVMSLIKDRGQGSCFSKQTNKQR